MAPAAAQSDAASQAWLAQMISAYDAGSAAPPANAPSTMAGALATWDWLRRPAKLGREPSMMHYANFLSTYADWPEANVIRRNAESLATNPRTSDFEARQYFERIAPVSASAQARLALLTAGDEALALARSAWRRTGLSTEQEAALLARFGNAFAGADDTARTDVLIWAGQVSAAARLLPRLDSDSRALASARIALRTNAPDADQQYLNILQLFPHHTGLIYDRAIWLERRGRLSEAEALLGRGLNDPSTVGATETWMRKRLELGQAAMRRGEFQAAWRVLSNHRTYDSSVDVGSLPLSERVLLSDTEWLAGWIALRRLNRPDDAAVNFQRFLAAVNTPVSRSRGEYWLGRAEKARGDQKAATAAFKRATSYFDYFYGQLAAEELGQNITLPKVIVATASPQDQANFQRSSLRQALEMLNQMGSRQRESQFVRALAASVETPGEARLVSELGNRIGRQDLGVWVWRNMRGQSDVTVFDFAYPKLPENSMPPSRDYVLAHGIARQESSFDRTALSHAGARGLMQLMPGTAQDVARRLGLPYDRERLFSDPAYNIRLGSYYIGMRRDGFRNPMLAIAAYNAGAGNVNRWLLSNGDPRAGTDPIDWIELIPFSETRTYVQRVIENSVVYSLRDPKAQGARTKASAWFEGP